MRAVPQPEGTITESPDPASTGPPRGQRRDEIWEAVRYALRVFLSLRVALFLLGLLAVALLPMNDAPSVPGWNGPAQAGGWHNMFTAWERWDALWFLRIADTGYAAADGSAAFFPLYPILVRAVSTVIGGHPLAAAMIVSNASFFVALVLVYLLTLEEWDRTVARRTVLYISIFPTAFFFLAPYSESLFLALSVGCLLAARRENWLVAAVCGALAAATRSMGILLILPLVAMAVTSWRAMPQPKLGTLVARLAAALSVGAGTFAYLLFWQLKNGEFWAPLTSQGGWSREFSFFWSSIAEASKQAWEYVGFYPGGYHQIDWVLVLIALAVAVWVALKARLPYALYTLAALLMPLTLIFEGRPFMSLPRFVLPLFPLFWGLARFAERFRAHDLVVATSAAGLGVLAVLYTNWYFVF
jgi:hypothetical protein